MTEIKTQEKEKLTIDLVKANIFAILLIIPVSLLYVVPYYLINYNDTTISNFKSFIDNVALVHGVLGLPILIITVSLIGVVAHELIHGAVWAQFTKEGFKSIKFGVLWKMLTPYCHCKEPLLIKHYILGAIMPAIILGVLPAIYAILFGSLGFLIFGIFFTIVAAGDFMIIYILRNEKMDDLVQDHPSEAGCFVFRK